MSDLKNLTDQLDEVSDKQGIIFLDKSLKIATSILKDLNNQKGKIRSMKVESMNFYEENAILDQLAGILSGI